MPDCVVPLALVQKTVVHISIFLMSPLVLTFSKNGQIEEKKLPSKEYQYQQSHKNQYIRNYMDFPHLEHPLSEVETAEKPSQVQIGPEIVQCNTTQIL